MSERVKYLSLTVAESLLSSIQQNLERYVSGDFSDMASGGGWSAELSVKMDPAPLRDLDSSNNAAAEYENSLLVWRSLRELPASVATENRVWTRLTHVECLKFSRARWLKNREGDELEDAIRKHMFAQTLTQYRDDNALSRLWWNYYIASRICPEEPKTALRMLVKSADIRLNFIERPWIGSRKSLCRGIVRLMTYDPWVTEVESNFRKVMTTINKLGGGVAFEVMQDREIDRFLRNARVTAETLDSSG